MLTVNTLREVIVDSLREVGIEEDRYISPDTQLGSLNLTEIQRTNLLEKLNQACYMEFIQPFTRSFYNTLEEYLTEHTVDDMAHRLLDYALGTNPPGDPGTIGATVFNCPNGDYTWVQYSKGTPVPNCPNHKIPLV
jgi:hypothetical protein